MKANPRTCLLTYLTNQSYPDLTIISCTDEHGRAWRRGRQYGKQYRPSPIFPFHFRFHFHFHFHFSWKVGQLGQTRPRNKGYGWSNQPKPSTHQQNQRVRFETVARVAGLGPACPGDGKRFFFKYLVLHAPSSWSLTPSARRAA